MLNHYFLPAGTVATLLLASLSPAQAQAPTIVSVFPVANERAALRYGPVIVGFNQPLTAASTGALKVFSSKRGGLRGGGQSFLGVSQTALAYNPNGSQPDPYVFQPGETVQLTVTRAAASAGGTLATPRVQQFTTEVTGPGRGGYFPGMIYPQPAAPGSIVTGDLNGDGILDLAVANPAANTVSLRLSGPGTNGGLGLLSGTDVPVGQGPRGLALADLDGDGDLDLLTANALGNSLSVCLNSGTGLFSGTLNVPTVAQPGSLAVGDIDGDGDLDVLVPPGNGTLAMPLFNNGTGTSFSVGGSIGVGANPGDAALGDIDNDGDLDLLTANNGAGSVSVCLNNGAGVFNSALNYPTGNGPLRLVLADVDGDFDLDVLVACSTDNTVRVHLNNGTGQLAAGYLVPTQPAPSALVLGDMDSDGDLDLLVATAQDGRLGVWTNNGTGTFSTSTNVLTGASPQSLVLGDVDSDGDLDVATANAGASTIRLFLNGGTGPLATTAGTTAPTLTAYPNPATGQVQFTLPPTATRAELLDALGRTVRTVPARAGQATLDVAGLPAGLYLVRAAGQVARLVVE